MGGPSRAIGLALFLGTLAVFWPLGNAGFVNYDDPGYVYENPHVSAGLTVDGMGWAWTTFHKANFHPLTWLSHMTDVELLGMDPGRHHMVNVLLHALSTLLLFAFLQRSTGAPWPSAFAAALFAIHPLHVESVAWISERKDVLSTLFWLLALHGYLSWARFGGGLRYFGILLLLAAGLASKPVVVTLPCVFLLMDVWPLCRTPWVPRGAGAAGRAESPTRLIVEKLPMFALVATASALTLQAQTVGGAVVGTPTLPMGARIANVAIAYGWYLEKMFWPAGLAVFYPHPYLGSGVPPGVDAWLGPLVMLVALTCLGVWQFVRRPYILIGWLWFLGTLVPMIGLVQVGAQATADRYSYVSLIGPFIVIAWLGAEVAAGGRWRRAVVGAIAVSSLLACIVLTRAQLPYWATAEALAERSVAVTDDNFVMHFNLALALQRKGDLLGARGHYERAIALEPSRGAFHGNLGTVLAALGEPEAAVGAYETAMTLDPDQPGHLNNLAWLLATYPDPGIRDGRRAVRLAGRAVKETEGRDAEALDTLAAGQAEAGNFGAAVRTAEWAARLAREAGEPGVADRIAARGRGYAARRAHREPRVPAP